MDDTAHVVGRTAVPIGPMRRTSETVKTRFSTRFNAKYGLDSDSATTAADRRPRAVSITAEALPVMSNQISSVT